jgi:hypothetical protein
MLGFILINNKAKSIRSIFKKDKIKGLLFLILLLTITTYFLNAGNIEKVSEINYYNTGLKPDNLYLKMAMNGIFLIVTGILAFSLGLSCNGKEEVIRSIIKFVINLITINAFFNIIAWVIQTGGVIGRYNFDLPIISSFGISIQWSILGFILQISGIKQIRKINFETIKLFILFLSILIIVSRENQLMFIIILILYLYFSAKKITKPLIVVYLLISFISIFYFAKSIFNTTMLDTYLAMLNPHGDDLMVRYDSILSGLKIFKHYIILGIGYGMFAGYNKAAVSITGVDFYLGSIHNGIISILVEMGVIGLFFNALLAIHIVGRLNRLRKNKFFKTHIRDRYVIAIFVFITVNIFASLISNYILLPPPSEYSYYGIAFISWLLIGLLLSFERKKEIRYA